MWANEAAGPLFGLRRRRQAPPTIPKPSRAAGERPRAA